MSQSARPNRNPVITVLLRRMRTPLLVLLTAYALAVLGFSLIPGQDDQGESWRMSLFHAFYVVSYTGSTIGFGEVPYTFSEGQRLWTIVSIYMTVIAWLYAVGALISTLRDPAFHAALDIVRLRKNIARLDEPFHMICGYGDTGALLVRAITERGGRAVVVETDAERVQALNLREHVPHVPAMHLDARNPEHLMMAGLRNRWCTSVLAVTDDDRTNLKISLAAKLLHPGSHVICRAESSETADNIASFGTDHIVNGYDHFAYRLHLAIRAPDLHRVYDWLTGIPNTELPERARPPAGHWLICGYGPLGRAVTERLLKDGHEITVIDETAAELPAGVQRVAGSGTQAGSLRQAGIAHADALLACTSDDADNLSTVMTARQLRDDLFIAARQNALRNKPLFEAANTDMTVEPSYIVSSQVLAILNASLLNSFLKAAEDCDASWHRELAEQIRKLADGRIPVTWTLRVSQKRTPVLVNCLEAGKPVALQDVMRNPANRDSSLDCLPLMLRRADRTVLRPAEDTWLETGDYLLFCGTPRSETSMRRSLRNRDLLEFLRTGVHRPGGWVWRKFRQWRMGGENGNAAQKEG
ncbi:NAD-binding protein [Methylonatrum kenyense]|uniref:potassium channel family protein n=1 Tax=Methylonatrum kenyense TaxID=455253 RepID=UPI0020C0A68C|nr:potassium channel protein [Methylonatrum kenyense]MCK8516709.1 NAD-binding protein [Methylonatrum kenyense]